MEPKIIKNRSRGRLAKKVVQAGLPGAILEPFGIIVASMLASLGPPLQASSSMYFALVLPAFRTTRTYKDARQLTPRLTATRPKKPKTSLEHAKSIRHTTQANHTTACNDAPGLENGGRRCWRSHYAISLLPKIKSVQKL